MTTKNKLNLSKCDVVLKKHRIHVNSRINSRGQALNCELQIIGTGGVC
ncbi:hypothetical protein FOLKNPGA_03431 [Legionella sp. PC1000]|nr:hypothetical protein FOLKNPGA_03431 [Legionella sp. PC1000]